MADYRLSAQVISRASGRSAVASAAYRSAARMVDERTGEIHDYRRKGGLVHEEILAPDNAPEWMRDRAQLWNAVEAVERRKDAQLAREIQLSLPHELDADQRRELIRGFIHEQFVDRGMVADLAIHEPGRSGDQRNHHAHVMLTMRELTGEWFGKKDRSWNAPELLKEYREQWAHHQNRALERHGHEARVDHRSYEDRGIDREPTQHLGQNAHEMEARGEASRIGDENREREARNSDRANDHRKAAQLKLEIEAEQRKFEWWADRKRDEIGHAQELADLDLSQKHDRQKAQLVDQLEQTYGTHKATVKAELDTIDRKLDAKGVRKVIRNVFGRTKADQSTRDDLRKTLASIEQRETERVTDLERRQKTELTKEKQRQQANRERLERGVETARNRREEQGWKRRDYHQPRHDPPTKTPQPTTTREQGQKAEAKRKTDFWNKKPAPEAKSPRSKAKDFWRSTSSTHEPADGKELRDRWNRSANDNTREPSNPFSVTDDAGRGRSAPSPSLGGGKGGKGQGGSGGNSGGSGGGAGGGGSSGGGGG